jgi:hypothetical protein
MSVSLKYRSSNAIAIAPESGTGIVPHAIHTVRASLVPRRLAVIDTDK